MNSNQVMLLSDLMRLDNDYLCELEVKYQNVIELSKLAIALDEANVELPLTKEKVTSFFESSGFLISCKTIIERVILDSDNQILPSIIECQLTKKKYKIKGEVWDIHKDDKDPFPSSPHAHNYDENVVLHLGTGELYRNRQLLGKMNKKSFKRFRGLINNVELPPAEA